MAANDKEGLDTIHVEGTTNTTSGVDAHAHEGIDAITNVPDAPDAAKAPQVAASAIANKDKAAQFLKQADHPIVVTPADNKRVLRKVDLRILPLILTVYCLQSLDKTTLSYTSVFGLIEDTNLVGDQFSWLGSIVYVAQLVFQPLVAYILVRFPIGKFSAIMVLCWGAVLCCMAAASNFAGLMATRFLLGSFEASVGKATRCWSTRTD